VARLPGRGRHDRRAAHATHGWPGLLVIRVASESEQQARRKKEILGGPDNSLSGLRARASNKRTVPPTACAFGAPITSNRGHPRQRATSAKEKRNPGWPGQLVVRVASESEQQADSGFRRLFASGEPRLQAIGATPHKGGLRVARTTRCPGCERKRATSEPSHLPLAPSAPRLQVIGATPHKGGLRVARTTRCPGCERKRATSGQRLSPLVRLRRTPIASNRGHPRKA